jgi:diaminopimelate decarboxylase
MEKLKYDRPTIIRHVSDVTGKFGRTRKARILKEIDGIPVRELVDQYGSPLFIFSESAIRRIYKDALRAFSVRYPKVQFAWSYKTNYLDAICRIYHQEGLWAEVVSEYEYEMARRNHVEATAIIYNGPYKPEHILRDALSKGALVHADHFDEMHTLEKIASEMDRPQDVGLRINMDTGIYPSWDRFGFNLENGEALNAVRRMHAGGKLKLKGLHAHIGTFIIEPSAYKIQTAKLAAFARTIAEDVGFTIDYIDIGGGFTSKNTLHEQYAPGTDVNPSIDVYADAITSSLLEAGFQQDSLPTLILEPGRALIDEAGYLLATVVANKRLPNGIRSIVLDVGLNTLFTAFWYKHDVLPTEEKEGMYEETVIYGPLCMNIDVIRPSIRLSAVDTGDLLAVFPVGAYNVTQWMQFIRMRPAVVLIDTAGHVSIIRDAETIDAFKDIEHVPGHLKS